MVYSADVITQKEDLAAQRRLSTLINLKLNQEYSKLCGFVRVRGDPGIGGGPGGRKAWGKSYRKVTAIDAKTVGGGWRHGWSAMYGGNKYVRRG